MIVAYAALVAFCLYTFELHHDWRPSQDMVPFARAWFVILGLLSLVALAFVTLWWLPAGVLAAAFVTAPLLSNAGFTLGYAVWGAMLVAAALSLGWAGHRRASVC